jgi:hypothetical protein
MDTGVFGRSRTPAIGIIVAGMLIFGLPSAISLDYLVNQDLVWGLGLILSGLCFSILIIKHGVKRFREEVINGPTASESDWKIGLWWELIMKFLVPIQVATLLGWWVIYTPIVSATTQWWNPFTATSLASVLVQWGLIAIACFSLGLLIKHKMIAIPALLPCLQDHFRRLFGTEGSDCDTATEQEMESRTKMIGEEEFDVIDLDADEEDSARK